MIRKFNYLLFVLFLSVFATIKAQILETNNHYGLKSFAQSQYLFDKGLLFLSDIEVQKLLEEFPESSSRDKALILLSDIDARSGNFIIADGKLKDFIEKRHNSPFVPFAGYKRGVMNFQSGKYDFAYENFKFAKEIALKQAESRGDSNYRELAHNSAFWQAVSASYDNKLDLAIKIFSECKDIDPNGNFADESFYALAEASSKSGKHKDAIKYFRKIRTQYPHSNSYLQSLVKEANTNLILRDYPTALVNLERAQRLFTSIQKQDSIGRQFEEQSNFFKTHENILYLRGEANNLAGNYEEALTYFNSFLGTFISSDLANHVRLGAGWSMLNLGRYDEALEYYDYVIKKSNKSDWLAKSSAQIYRVVALKLSGNIDKAKKEMTALSIQSGFPYVGEVLLELGQIYFEEKDYHKARKTLERADREAIDAVNTTRIFLLLGATYLEMGLWQRAINVYDKALELASNSLIIYMPKKEWYIREAMYKKGVASIKSGNSINSIKDLSAFISKENDADRKMEAMFWLAEAYYRADMHKNAIQTYESLLANYPRTERREEALYGLGWAYFITKKFQKSSKVFDRMIDEYPKSKYAIEVVARLADGYYMSRNYKQASGFYKKAIDLSPNSKEGIYCAYQRCHCLWKMGKFREAENSLFKFVTQHNKAKMAPFAMYLLGWIKFQQRKYEESISNFQYLIEAFPNSTLIAKTNFTIADAYFNKYDYENAIVYYKILIEDYPSSALAPEALDALRVCYSSLGRQAEAIELVNDYTGKNPDSPFNYSFAGKKGEIHFNNGQFADAISEYNELIKKYPKNKKNDEAMFWIAQSYGNMEQKEESSKAYVRVQTSYPKSRYAPMSILQNALLYKNSGEVKTSDSLFASLEELYPKSDEAPQAGFERALSKYMAKDSIGAITQWNNTANLYGETPYALESRFKVALFYRRNQQTDSARSAYQKLGEVSREENMDYAAEANYRIGELWLKDKEIDLAIESFIIVKEKYSEYEDWFTLSLLKLGELYEGKKQWADAEELYKIILELRQDDDYGKTAKRRLKRVARHIEK